MWENGGKHMACVATFSQVNLDILFSGMPQMPDLGEEVFANDFDIQLGGGAMAPAIILGRLGIDTRLGTFLSEDILSVLSKQLLDKENVNYTNFYKGNRNPVVVTSIASFTKDRSFICYNSGINEQGLKGEAIYTFLTGAKVCFAITGHNDVMKKLKEEGTKIVYDMGWDENLSIHHLKNTLENVHVFTPNDKEALKMTGTKTVEEALEVIDQYVEHAIVKIGSRGCITKYKGEIIHVPLVSDYNAIDTTGAGDNFLAGVMYGLFHDWDIIKCMQMGNVIGGYSTTELGCYKAHLTIEKAMDYMKKYEQGI